MPAYGSTFLPGENQAHDYRWIGNSLPSVDETRRVEPKFTQLNLTLIVRSGLSFLLMGKF